MTTPPTTPQARCEQIAREITEKWLSKALTSTWLDEKLQRAITTSLLAAEERGRQEERFRKHDPVAVKVAIDAMWEKVRKEEPKSEPSTVKESLTAQGDSSQECREIAVRIIADWVYGEECYHPKTVYPTQLRIAIAAALQAERDKLASVEESARRVIEQAVQVLATRPITGERHTVLTELEAWLAEHLVPVKSCPEGDDAQRESAENP